MPELGLFVGGFFLLAVVLTKLSEIIWPYEELDTEYPYDWELDGE